MPLPLMSNTNSRVSVLAGSKKPTTSTKFSKLVSSASVRWAYNDASSSVIPRSALLHFQPADEVALAERHAVGAQDVVGGGGVEIEVGQRERHQKPLCREGEFVIADVKDDIAAAERIDRLRRPCRQSLDGLRDEGLQSRIIVCRLR